MQAAWAFGCDNREEEVRAFWNGKLNGSIIAASRQKIFLSIKILILDLSLTLKLEYLQKYFVESGRHAKFKLDHLICMKSD